MARSAQEELAAFTAEKKFRGKGRLSVALVVTQHARKMGLPLDPAQALDGRRRPGPRDSERAPCSRS